MSLDSYWRLRAQRASDWHHSEAHLVVHIPDKYTFPGGVLACSVWPFVASEVSDARIQRGLSAPTCDRCKSCINWLLTLEALDELKQLAAREGVLAK